MIKIEDNGLGFKENEKQKNFLTFLFLKKKRFRYWFVFGKKNY